MFFPKSIVEFDDKNFLPGLYWNNLKQLFQSYASATVRVCLNVCVYNMVYDPSALTKTVLIDTIAIGDV